MFRARNLIFGATVDEINTNLDQNKYIFMYSFCVLDHSKYFFQKPVKRLGKIDLDFFPSFTIFFIEGFP